MKTGRFLGYQFSPSSPATHSSLSPPLPFTYPSLLPPIHPSHPPPLPLTLLFLLPPTHHSLPPPLPLSLHWVLAWGCIQLEEITGNSCRVQGGPGGPGGSGSSTETLQEVTPDPCFWTMTQSNSCEFVASRAVTLT